MEQHDELAQLVKSLTKSEKKFFTQYVNIYEKGSSPIYLQVFEYLNKEEEYTDEKIFKKFRDETFRKNFPVTKHYLKGLIIKTLRHSELTIREDKDLTVQVLDIKRLMAKGLFPMAKKMIEKLKAEAYQQEKFLDVIHLIAMQRGLISRGYYNHEPAINLDTLDDEEEYVMKSIRQLRMLMNASIKLDNQLRYETDMQPEEAADEVKHLGKIIQHLKYEELTSSKIKHIWLQFWAMYYCAIGDYKKYLEFANRKLEFVKHEKLPHTVSNWLITAYNHCLSASLLTNDFSEFETRLKFLEGLDLQSHFHDADRFQTVSMYALLYYMRTNNEKKIQHYIAYSLEGLNRFSSFIHKSFTYTLRTTIAYAYLRLKKLDECLNEVNDLMSLTDSETRRDYVGHVKIINLMLRFEMKEYQYLTYLLKNTYRFFMNSLYTTPVHRFMIDYMKESLKTKGRDNLQQLNETYIDKLRELRYTHKEAELALVTMMEDYLGK